jgi:hypothetical protein
MSQEVRKVICLIAQVPLYMLVHRNYALLIMDCISFRFFFHDPTFVFIEFKSFVLCTKQ